LALIAAHAIIALLALAQAATGTLAVAPLETVTAATTSRANYHSSLWSRVGTWLVLSFIRDIFIKIPNFCIKISNFCRQEDLIAFFVRVIVEEASVAHDGGIGVHTEDGVSRQDAKSRRLRIHDRNVLLHIVVKRVLRLERLREVWREARGHEVRREWIRRGTRPNAQCCLNLVQVGPINRNRGPRRYLERVPGCRCPSRSRFTHQNANAKWM
jgi:hypothetical protein